MRACSLIPYTFGLCGPAVFATITLMMGLHVPLRQAAPPLYFLIKYELPPLWQAGASALQRSAGGMLPADLARQRGGLLPLYRIV